MTKSHLLFHEPQRMGPCDANSSLKIKMAFANAFLISKRAEMDLGTFLT